MESNSVVLCENLIKWLKTLDLKAHHGTPSELSDGVAIAEALTQIAPEFFTPAWNSKIKTEVTGHNWRLKVSNLKKILDGVLEYHQDILNLSLQEFSSPEVINIAETADPSDLGRLLQLVLSCAVNCNKKEEYITRIMEMELSCQGSIMQAIQELETLTLGGSRDAAPQPPPPAQTDEEIKEALRQRCHDLDNQVRVLIEEKNTLQSEMTRLIAAQEAARGPEVELDDNDISMGPIHPGTLRYNQMQARLERLKNELDKVELQRDVAKVKADELEAELAIVNNRNEELQRQALENAGLSDEVDILTEAAARVPALEAQVASYAARMDELRDLKREVQNLLKERDDNESLANQRLQEVQRLQTRSNQLEFYINKVTELNDKLDQTRDKLSKTELENKKLMAEAAWWQKEKKTLVQEKDALKETVEELRCSNGSTIPGDANSRNVSSELMPTDVRERVARLERENQQLRESKARQEHAAAQAIVDDYEKRLERLRAINQEANHRIMELETAQEQPANQRHAPDGEDGQRKSLQVEELQGLLTSERRLVAKLQEDLATRESDLSALQDRYNKSIEKAKQVVASLNPRTATGQQSITDVTLGYSQAAAGTSAPAAAITNNKEWSGGGGGARAASVDESRLLASAWHQLGARCHRDAVDTRLRLLSAGHSFLARQRMQPPRARPAPAPRHSTPAAPAH